MEKCQFCDRNTESVIFESEYSVVYSFNTGTKRGHFVVAPKHHIPTFTQLNTEHIIDMFDISRKITEKMLIVTGAEKYYLASIGDSGSHFHIHFIPKKKDDPMLGEYIFSDKGWKGHLTEKWPDDKFDLYISEIRNELGEIWNE